MKKNIKQGFSLIELLVAITIFFIISLMVYAPYGYYMNKTKVKYTNNELSQAIYEGRNAAVNGRIGVGGNVSIGLYFSSDSLLKNNYQILQFPNTLDPRHIDLSHATAVDVVKLQPGIQIESFAGSDQGMIFFQAITGNTWIYIGESLQEYSGNQLDIDFSYKGSSGPLRNTLKFFKNTQIVDY